MKSGVPELSVLVVSTGRRPTLAACLSILRAQADAAGAELVLIVNAPPEHLPQSLRTRLAALCDTLAFEPRPGKSNGLNRGVAICRGSVIAFTDDDALPVPGWLEAVTEPLRAPGRPPALVGCGGPVRPVHDAPPPAWYQRILEGRRTHFLGPLHDFGDRAFEYAIAPDRSADCPIGANCAYRAELFATRRFDPSLGPNTASGGIGGEDTAFGIALLQEGLRLCYAPKAVVHHPVGPERLELEGLRKRFFEHGRARVRTRTKLGQPLPSILRLRAKRRGAQALRPFRRLLDPVGDTSRALRLEYWRGMQHELRRPGAPHPDADRRPPPWT